jgi:hypothetical protein
VKQFEFLSLRASIRSPNENNKAALSTDAANKYSYLGQLKIASTI